MKKKNPSPDDKKKSSKSISGEDQHRREDKIDNELEQSFPASDPPSYSQPGNTDIKTGGKNSG